MYLRKEKGRLWKLTGIFFGAMLVFTLLSRAVYQKGIAVVNTASAANGVIAHSLNISGKTMQNQELAVTTEAGLRVASVPVNEGAQVAAGDVLFTLDLAYLEETILYQEQELEKQRLSIQDAQSQVAATQQQRANEQARASENYNSAMTQAEVTRARALQALERAKTALDAFYKGESAQKAQEELLTKAVQEASGTVSAAEAALAQLQQELETKIQEAIAAAQAPEEGQTEPKVLTQPELDAIAQTVREGYAAALAEQEGAVSQAKASLADAQAALAAFRQQSVQEESEEALLRAVEQAQEAYDDAILSLESTETSYGRAIQSASLGTGSNHSARIGQITYDQMALALEKLKALREAEGKILAPVEGIVTQCNVQTGEKTTDSTALLLADLSQGSKFSCLVTEEQSKYIGVGDKVILQAGSNGKLYRDLPVTTFAPAGESGEEYRLTVQLPAGTLPMGAAAQLQFTRKSQPYSICVPLTALRLDERNQPYVLVAEPVETVLGTQQQAVKRSVTVLDQNETTAALGEGTLLPGQKVIVGSDRPISGGSRIRVE